MLLQITLEAARVNAKYTQKEAATKLGISNSTLVSWEKGKSMPKANQIIALCDLYGVDYDNLIFLPTELA